MDRMRNRRPSVKVTPTEVPKVAVENFQPSIEWTQDPSNHILLVRLPGFKREELRVQLDNVGKILVKGTKQAADGSYVNLDQSFDVPENSIKEKISGKFEDECLYLTMPKKVVDEVTVSQKEKREPIEEPIQQEEPRSGKENTDEESIQEKPKDATAKNDEEPRQQKPRSSSKVKKDQESIQEDKPNKSAENDDEKAIQERLRIPKAKNDEEPKQQEEPKSSSEEKKDEHLIQPKSKNEGKKDQEAIQKEKPKGDEEPIHKKKLQISDDNKTNPIPTEKAKIHDKEGNSTKKKLKYYGEVGMKQVEELIRKEKPTCSKDDGSKAKEGRKRGAVWRDAEENGWLDYGLVDGLMEKMNRNRKVIAVAVVAFTVGFYVSHKLRSSGR